MTVFMQHHLHTQALTSECHSSSIKRIEVTVEIDKKEELMVMGLVPTVKYLTFYRKLAFSGIYCSDIKFWDYTGQTATFYFLHLV